MQVLCIELDKRGEGGRGGRGGIAALCKSPRRDATANLGGKGSRYRALGHTKMSAYVSLCTYIYMYIYLHIYVRAHHSPPPPPPPFFRRPHCPRRDFCLLVFRTTQKPGGGAASRRSTTSLFGITQLAEFAELTDTRSSLSARFPL